MAERLDVDSRRVDNRPMASREPLDAPTLDWIGRLSGHAWTVWPLVRDRLNRDEPPPAVPWSTPAETRGAPGVVHLKGRLSLVDPCRLVILVHGLGGCHDSRYLRRAAVVAAREGLSSLRIDLRGADGSGDDLYHAGLSSDLATAVADPALAGFDEIVLLGFSLGGHLVLRFGTETTDPRIRAVAAICSPVDLASTVSIFDAPAGALYRRYVLSGLKRAYRVMAQRRPVPTPLDRIERVRRIREWDELTVVPHFGFDSADHYYSSQSVAPRLGDLQVPALLIASERDPMVEIETIRHALPTSSDRLTVRLLHAGGHVAFPDRVDLHLDDSEMAAPRRGVVGQALRWLVGC